MEEEQINLLPLEPAPEEPPRRRPALYFFSILLLALLLIYGIRHFTLARWPSEGVAYDARTLRPKGWRIVQSVKNFIFHGDNLLAGQADDRINILLLGMGGPGHDGPYLTDTNIIASIKPSTKEVALVSVPRDLGVEIPGQGGRKINYANHAGETQNPGKGGEFARQIFAKTFELDIPYYIRVDFKAFVELIDAVGGISVTIPRSFTDSEYPGPDNSYQTISFSAGPQRLDGATALIYARSRHGTGGEGSDFARSRRQQQALSALKDRLLSLDTFTNPARIQSILETLANHVHTNLDFGQLMYLASFGREVTGTPRMLVLDDGINGYLAASIAESGAYLLEPKDGSFAVINAAIKNIFDQTSSSFATAGKPTPLIAKPGSLASIEIQNGTWRAGLASRLEQKLESKGIIIATIGNSVKRPLPATIIIVLNAKTDPGLVEKLSRELTGAPTLNAPDWLAEGYDNPATAENESGIAKYGKNTDILILLGENTKE